jgi:hypothetical protein
MREIRLKDRRYWILSEPHPSGWKASVVELVPPERNIKRLVGIDATRPTRGAADEAAERKLRRLLQTPRLQLSGN